jgi:photosystem II stability/assembly factor-like uncharacterized protein
MTHRTATAVVLGVVAITSLAFFATSMSAPAAGISTAAPRLETVSFFNPTVGYGLFWQNPGGFCELAVAKTTDGGATFAAPVPVAPCGPFNGGTMASLAFDDHGDGFLYSTSLYVTHDGGTSWQPDPQPGSVVSVEALGDSIWMLEADCAQPASETLEQQCPLQVHESANGGRSWAPSPTQPPSASMTGRVGRWGSLVRVTTTAAYVVAAPPTPTSAPNRTTPGTVPLYFTADGGQSWVQDTIPCGADAQQAIASAAPGGTLFALCGWFTQVGGQQRKAVLVSTDEGASWSERTTCTGLFPQCSLASGYLGVVDAVSSSTAFAIGSRGQLLETTDGGSEWSTSQLNGGGGGPTDLVFFDPSDGVALTTTHLWHTADAGQTWSETTPVVGTAAVPTLTRGHIDSATLPAPIRAAVSAIGRKTAVAIEAPDVVPPSLSATAKVARTSYSVSLFECPETLRFGTPAIGSGSCGGPDHTFGGFGGRVEASAISARAALRMDGASALGCPANRKVVREATTVFNVVQMAVSGAVCELTWKDGRWTVEIVGALAPGSATTIALPVIETLEHTSTLPGSAGVLLIDRTADGDHTFAWWTQGSSLYEPSADHTLTVALSLVADMTPVSGGRVIMPTSATSPLDPHGGEVGTSR